MGTSPAWGPDAQVSSAPGAGLRDSLLPPGGHSARTADGPEVISPGADSEPTAHVAIPWAVTVGPTGGPTALFTPSDCLSVKLRVSGHL